MDSSLKNLKPGHNVFSHPVRCDVKLIMLLCYCAESDLYLSVCCVATLERH